MVAILLDYVHLVQKGIQPSDHLSRPTCTYRILVSRQVPHSEAAFLRESQKAYCNIRLLTVPIDLSRPPFPVPHSVARWAIYISVVRQRTSPPRPSSSSLLFQDLHAWWWWQCAHECGTKTPLRLLRAASRNSVNRLPREWKQVLLLLILLFWGKVHQIGCLSNENLYRARPVNYAS